MCASEWCGACRDDGYSNHEDLRAYSEWCDEYGRAHQSYAEPDPQLCEDCPRCNICGDRMVEHGTEPGQGELLHGKLVDPYCLAQYRAERARSAA